MPADALVPSLLMQPLLENAIGHGIESLPEGGTVTVHGRVDGETIEIGVSNPLPPDRRPASSGHRSRSTTSARGWSSPIPAARR